MSENVISVRPQPLLARSLNQRANVYDVAEDGTFTKLLFSNVRCFVIWRMPNTMAAPGRALRADVVRLIYDPTIHIPEGILVQVVGTGRKYMTLTGTDALMVSLWGVPYYNSVDLEEAE